MHLDLAVCMTTARRLSASAVYQQVSVKSRHGDRAAKSVSAKWIGLIVCALPVALQWFHAVRNGSEAQQIHDELAYGGSARQSEFAQIRVQQNIGGSGG